MPWLGYCHALAVLAHALAGIWPCFGQVFVYTLARLCPFFGLALAGLWLSSGQALAGLWLAFGHALASF